MKRILLLFSSLLIAASSASAAAFFTKATQGQVNTWASIWTNASQTTAVAPAAGNTYEAVANTVPFGASATGGGVNNTRVRNPYGAGAPSGVHTFPGDSLTLSVNSEFRFKNDNITLTSVNFPGVGGNPGLILNGGALNAGNDFVFAIDGNIRVTATSLICPADQGAGAVLPLRGFNIIGALSGSGDLMIIQASTNVAQQVSGVNNSYSGNWIVKAGWLKGNSAGSLGTGNIIVDPLIAVPITTASVLSNGPAQVELMYDIGTSGTLTLVNGGKMILHQHCVFGGVTIEGTPLSVGKHTYPELAAAYPNNFAPGGSGSITVGRVVTVNTVNNDSPGAGETSLKQALSGLQEGDVIRFNIPGAGPHVIVTPIGGYPLITVNNVTIDGYSQPGSSPNTNPILGGNNAQIKIVLDSTGADSAPNPDPITFPDRPLRRSTRLDFPAITGNTGYGESENCIIGVYEGDNATIRGLSFIARHTAGSENDPSIYAVALIKQATNAHVNGCWFGTAPGGSSMADVKPVASAVAAFRWRIGGDVYSDGLRFGTDGDGANDRAEFNVALGCRIGLALELPGARVSGNYINVFPNGLTFVDVDAIYDQLVTLGGGESVEVLENGRFAHNTIIGTDGNGISDSDERNVFSHPVYDHDIEFYSAGTNIVIAGNYVGVGIDGLTAGPLTTNGAPNFLSVPGSATVRIGSNGDGVSDDVEGNLIVNGSGSQFVEGSSIPTINRRNKFVNCNYRSLANDSSLTAAVLNAITNNVLSGTMPAPSAVYGTAMFIDLYAVDPAALAKTNYWPAPVVHPSRYLGSFTDNGPGDLDTAVGSFAFDLSSYGLTDGTYVTVLVTHSQDALVSNAGAAATGPAAWPVSRRPELKIRVLGQTTELSWLGPENAFTLQNNGSLNPADWAYILGGTVTYTTGRNITEVQFDTFANLLVYRLISQ